MASFTLRRSDNIRLLVRLTTRPFRNTGTSQPGPAATRSIAHQCSIHTAGSVVMKPVVPRLQILQAHFGREAEGTGGSRCRHCRSLISQPTRPGKRKLGAQDSASRIRTYEPRSFQAIQEVSPLGAIGFTFSNVMHSTTVLDSPTKSIAVITGAPPFPTAGHRPTLLTPIRYKTTRINYPVPVCPPVSVLSLSKPRFKSLLHCCRSRSISSFALSSPLNF
ncbi:hypothetical protein H4582DRAFT_226683 [Lactarius indigo]|nr:hypothetical protein H4582DRAFT_226683 [Lactarius indigo]